MLTCKPVLEGRRIHHHPESYSSFLFGICFPAVILHTAPHWYTFYFCASPWAKTLVRLFMISFQNDYGVKIMFFFSGNGIPIYDIDERQQMYTALTSSLE